MYVLYSVIYDIKKSQYFFNEKYWLPVAVTSLYFLSLKARLKDLIKRMERKILKLQQVSLPERKLESMKWRRIISQK